MENGLVTAAEEKSVKPLGFLRNKGTNNFSARVITVNGKLTAEQFACLAEASKLYRQRRRDAHDAPDGGMSGNTIRQDQRSSAPSSQRPPLKRAAPARRCAPVVSCKGDDLPVRPHRQLRRFAGDTRALLQRLPARCVCRTSSRLRVGGCPNNCVKPDLNDVGIIGQLVPRVRRGRLQRLQEMLASRPACPIGAAKLKDGLLEIDRDKCNNCGHCVGKCHFDAVTAGTRGYKIYIGGRWGKSTATGRALSKIFPTKEEALETIEKAILLFREQGKTGERFSQTIARPRLRIRGEGAARRRHNVAQAADSRRGAARHGRRDLLARLRKNRNEAEGPRLFRFLYFLLYIVKIYILYKELLFLIISCARYNPRII